MFSLSLWEREIEGEGFTRRKKMHPILLKFGPFTIYSYGFMVASAFLSGIFLAAWLAKRENIPAEKIFDLALYVLLSSIIGARIFYVIEFWRDYITNPISALFIWQGGLVFYGGLIFAIAAIFVYARITNVPSLKLFDIISPATALGYAIGRIGCFLNGCCYGIETCVPWAVKFPNISGLRHPTQIYASIAGFLICGLLLFLFGRKRFDGQIFTIGLILYSVYRFLIEFIRVNPRYLLVLSEAQWGSALIFAVALVIYFKLSKKKP
jgi:phosphatidylglycerol:prolipoprotein diacylglycerol transferase